MLRRGRSVVSRDFFVMCTFTGGIQCLHTSGFVCQVVTPDDLLQKSQVFIYGNGNTQAPTAVEFKRDLLKELLFNQSPAKVRITSAVA